MIRIPIPRALSSSPAPTTAILIEPVRRVILIINRDRLSARTEDDRIERPKLNTECLALRTGNAPGPPKYTYNASTCLHMP